MRPRGKVRYAVVGLGDIAQEAVLPSFEHARDNSELTALVSSNLVKLRKLSRLYRVKNTFATEDYAACLQSGEVDAVYLALPNNLHCRFTVQAARAGLHVLCEKPLAVTEEECQLMIRECARHHGKLMTAYRLHFEPANLDAIEIVQSGKLGEVRIFNSTFSMQVEEGNIRLQRTLGGGTLYDIGIYCINAARYLFQAEPTECFAFSANQGDKRFRQIDEMTSALLRFPGERLASFTASFGADSLAVYEVLGTKGHLRAENAYSYKTDIELQVKIEGKEQTRRHPRTDQFAAELVYFSDCILRNQEPEPSGIEGLMDVHIVRSLYESARTGAPVKLRKWSRARRPGPRQRIARPPVRKSQRIQF